MQNKWSLCRVFLNIILKEPIGRSLGLKSLNFSQKWIKCSFSFLIQNCNNPLYLDTLKVFSSRKILEVILLNYVLFSFLARHNNFADVNFSNLYITNKFLFLPKKKESKNNSKVSLIFIYVFWIIVLPLSTPGLCITYCQLVNIWDSKIADRCVIKVKLQFLHSCHDI